MDAATVELLESIRDRLSEGSIRLQGIGKHPAIPASEVKVGDTMVFNAGETSKVTAVKPSSSGKTVSISFDSGHTKKFKASKLVGINRRGLRTEARPGPHWNPWPQRKILGDKLGKSLVELAKIAHKYPENIDWGKETIDLVANIGWAVQKDDKTKVKKLLPLLIKQREVSQGMVNDINNWLRFGQA